MAEMAKTKKPKPEGVGEGPREGWTPMTATNVEFVKYYKAQNMMEESEWDGFMASLAKRLPTTFRITGTRSHAEGLRDILEKEYFPGLATLESESVAYQKPSPLPWYPGHLSFHCEIPREFLRKSSQYVAFQRFLVDETDLGNISRQEAVSMIPPLLLDVKPGHKVLDMCAAPGSKTAQLIEALHETDTAEGERGGDGLVVANDLDARRCHMLVHQVKRLRSPCLVVTNENAAHYPTVYLPGTEGQRTPLMFDRVLCDVPCSGDGTLRKNPRAWKGWHPMMGPANHTLQIRILTRGVQMAIVGGLIVYSTCSFHPVENEAVVAQVLRDFKGKLELVDVADKLPLLKRRPGLVTWKVFGVDEKGQWDVVNSVGEVNESHRKKFRRSMFAQEDVAALGLAKSLRLLPQDQDTGGFYVAVLRKTAPLSSLDYRHERLTGAVISEPSSVTTNQELAEDEHQQAAANQNKEIDECQSKAAIPEIANCEQSGEQIDQSEPMETISVDQSTAKPDDDNQSLSSESQHSQSHPLKSQQLKAFKEDPFVFLTDNVPSGVEVATEGRAIMQSLRDFYGLSSSFPDDRLIIRTKEGKGRFVYALSPQARDLIMGNQSLALRLVNAGVKVFGRSEAADVAVCFRLQQEGVLCVVPHMRERAIEAHLDDVVMILSTVNGVHFESVSQDLQDKMKAMGPGSVIFQLDPQQPMNVVEGSLLRERLELCMWIGRRGVRPMVNQMECFSILRLLLGVTRANQLEQQYNEQRAAANQITASKSETIAVSPPLAEAQSQ